MSQNIEALKAEYELSKSKARVEELSYINNNRALALEKSRIFRNIILSGVCVLLIILGLLYNQYRLKQKANKEISNKNLALQILLNEKEWLLKEIHHRVKNNLQIVMSLLNTQSAYLDNEAALSAIRESQHRMQAMSLIHQKLYLSDNVTTIHMPAYIRELVNYLKDSYDIGYQIYFELEIDPINLDVAQAVPLGLILNEAVTNAIKHAFPEKQTGTLTIRFFPQGNDLLMLSIADNGVGLPLGFDASKIKSLGMNLMRGLSKQLGGDFILESRKGLSISITFKDEKIMSTDAQRISESNLQTVAV
jgi:two-component sensor histidine kinase